MSFISPKLIARIYHALGQNRGSDAVLLLRQQAFATRFCPITNGQLVAEVVRIADQSVADDELERACEHYELGLALYQLCFLDSHVDGLRCVAGLLKVYDARRDAASMLPLLDLGQQIAAGLRRELCKPKAVAAIEDAA